MIDAAVDVTVKVAVMQVLVEIVTLVKLVDLAKAPTFRKRSGKVNVNVTHCVEQSFPSSQES